MSNSKSPLSYGVPVGAAIIAFGDGRRGRGRGGVKRDDVYENAVDFQPQEITDRAISESHRISVTESCGFLPHAAFLPNLSFRFRKE